MVPCSYGFYGSSNSEFVLYVLIVRWFGRSLKLSCWHFDDDHDRQHPPNHRLKEVEQQYLMSSVERAEIEFRWCAK